MNASQTDTANFHDVCQDLTGSGEMGGGPCFISGDRTWISLGDRKRRRYELAHSLLATLDRSRPGPDLAAGLGSGHDFSAVCVF